MKLVAFGGGHGLAAALRALRRCQPTLGLELTAVVTVGDNGGSSGQLRRLRGCLPPGDLRQALAALAPLEPPGEITAQLLQYRFAPRGNSDPDPLAGHPVGNLMLCGLMELLGDPVAALDHVAGLVGASGRVLPMCREVVGIEAEVRGADRHHPDDLVTVHGQHEVAVSPGRVESVRLDPARPTACPDALTAVAQADWLVFGPGSWYTSVIPHLLVPELAAAILASTARRLVILNLSVESETAGLTVPEHLTALTDYARGFTAEVVLGDAAWVPDPEPLRQAAKGLGARLVLADVAAAGDQARHDPEALAQALLPLLAAGR